MQNKINKNPLILTLLYMIIYYDFMLHVAASFVPNQLYLNRK
jgi:hypothetical protein